MCVPTILTRCLPSCPTVLCSALVSSRLVPRRNSPKKEKWGKNNVFTNNVEAPSYMVNLPENGKLKEGIFEGLRPVLEEWSGVRWHDMT